MTRITFQEISLRAVFKWKQNGKSRQRTKKFYQTISPFNTDGHGKPKARDQIMRELIRERDTWLIAQGQSATTESGK